MDFSEINYITLHSDGLQFHQYHQNDYKPPNFKNQSQQTDLRKHFPGETYTTTSNTMNQSLRENNT
jgi:hypothetical protein